MKGQSSCSGNNHSRVEVSSAQRDAALCVRMSWESMTVGLLQAVLGGAQDGELVAVADAARVVQGQVEDSDTAQALVLDVGRLVAGGLGVLVADPEAALVGLLGQAEGVRAQALAGVTDAAQQAVVLQGDQSTKILETL